ncbi:MAG TPA: type II toxin-antitoxin system HipA family toxin [Xanthobacteraceae bacterium]|nr:type II toxin-antitoxin system HipA family toxin [Xanthobacteraceae bacterium]
MATLPVHFEQRVVGAIDVDKSGPGFRYDPDWIVLRGAFPISITMPLNKERIASDTFLPWAANLLPENEQLRTLGQILGMARSDVIGLLAAIGGDTAGALSIGQPGRTATVQWRPMVKPDELEKLIEDLPNKPFLAGDEGVSMSLAGGQTKLAVAVDDAGRICIPMNGSPSTHILKPDSSRLCGSVQNEAFCLTLARRVKIPTSSITTGQAGKRTYLLARRFDRADVGGRWRRLHQEDYCQALGKPPTAKYESNQTGICGPTLKDMFELTRRHMLSSDVVRLLDLIIFNVLACNTDAHAKNYSIMLRGNGASLAPMYDVMCGVVWENVTKKMVQKIGGATRADHLTGRHWRQFADECSLNPRQVLDRVAALAKSVIAEAGMAESEVAAMPAGRHAILCQTRQAIERRARALLTQLQEFGGGAVTENVAKKRC